MGSQGAITLNSPAFWVAIVITLLVIALVTYVYSGRNLRQTIILTLLSAVVVGCAAGYDSWSLYLNRHFLAGIDQLGVFYRASRGGWYLLLDAWPLWVIPNLFVLGIYGACAWYLQKRLAESAQRKAQDVKPKRQMVGLSREMVANQLELDTLKKALATANQKLNQVIYEKGVEEAKAKDLKLKLKQYEEQAVLGKSAIDDNRKALTLEIAAKTKQIEQLTEQLNQQEDELNRLRELLESLLNSRPNTNE